MSYAIAIGLIAGSVAIALGAFGALVWWLTTPGPLEEEEYQAFVDSLAEISPVNTPYNLPELKNAIRSLRPDLEDGLGGMEIGRAFAKLYERLGWEIPPRDTLLSDSAQKIIDELRKTEQ